MQHSPLTMLSRKIAMSPKSPLPSTLAIYGSRLLSAAIQAIALVALAAAVSPATLGVVSVAIALLGAIGIIAQFGLEPSAGRALAQGRDLVAIRIKSYHTLVIFSVAVLIAATICLIYFLRSGNFPLSLILLAPWVFLERQNAMNIGLTIAEGQAIRASISIAVGKLLGVGILYVSITSTLLDPVVSYLIFLNVSSVLSSLILPRFRFIRSGRENSLSFAEALREARPFWIASLSGQARSLDTVLVGALAGATSAGLYAFPARTVGPMRLVSTSLGAVAMPSTARREWRQVAQLERAMWALCVVFLVGTFIVWREGERVFTALLGHEYAQSASIVSVLMLGVVFNIPGALWSSILQGSGEARLVAQVGIWLIPLFYLFVITGTLFSGAKGAAVGVTVTFIVQFIIMFLFRIRDDWPVTK